jgi:mono/diheme cytochrome c family protein
VLGLATIRRFPRRLSLIPLLVGAAIWIACFALMALAASAQSTLSPHYAKEIEALTPAERAGSEIWFNATAFNDRFFTYSYPQRLGGAIDWYRILAADKKKDIFQAWGGIPDPDCCVPGDANCPAKSKAETYGFQWCPGDAALLSFVGKQGYRDPACDLKDAPLGGIDQRQDPCDLRFGTSTGVLGLRKFPNPRFDAKAWAKLNGSAASWEGYRAALKTYPSDGETGVNRLLDGSIEPPFRIGMACGACHIGYKPTQPPADSSNPQWSNIDGLVGNQYSRISNLLGSGFSKHALEWQLIARARPGIVDTSALPMDYVSNPSTMNAIINFAQRPLHEHEVMKWRKAAACPADAKAERCWCEPGKPGKCWERTVKKELVPNILKGGEDSVGMEEAIQRVYFNIGSCAEQCWLNHIPDIRAADPKQRNYGQSPFDIGQCRRDCASFRAIEDRLPDLKAFFLQARPSDLWKARGLADSAALTTQLDAQFSPGAVKRGRDIFARQCASCHSSQSGPFDATDFHATVPGDPSLRADWLGNDKVEPASEIGTDAGRAMHSNHMPTRVWAQYAALDLENRKRDPARAEVMSGAGRGYYRNVSLLSAWAHAPFMHNNAVGPEICGKPINAQDDFYDSPYVDAKGAPLANAPACLPFDTSVEGRFQLYVASMRDMLNPSKRPDKMHLLSDDIIVNIAPKLQNPRLKDLLGIDISLRIPKGTPAVAINSLRFKDLIQDAVLLKRDQKKLDSKYAGLLDKAALADLKKGLRRFILDAILKDQPTVISLVAEADSFVQRFYSNLLDRVENRGHRFGETLSDQDKDALIAFVATL